MSAAKVERRTNRARSVRTLDEEYGQKGTKPAIRSVCSPRAMPTHSHYESSPISNLGYLPNRLAVE